MRGWSSRHCAVDSDVAIEPMGWSMVESRTRA